MGGAAMIETPADTEELLDRAALGDDSARQQLLARHRDRLRRMVAARLDRRLVARVDPSDVVQEALAAAAENLDGYLRDRPLPFYPWLRHFAWDRLMKLHRHHIKAQRRSITREEAWIMPDESAQQLANRLLARSTNPVGRLIREELRDRIRAALAKLAEPDREVLVMRHLEHLSIDEIAAVLSISEGAVKVRHLRALRRLKTLLEDKP
jgi:RNA polymerase sigma-70 factor (ECF subfamily)